MFSHVMLGADDVLAAKTFYDAILGTIGIAEGVIDEWGGVVCSTDAGRFLITKPINRLPATFANGVAFSRRHLTKSMHGTQPAWRLADQQSKTLQGSDRQLAVASCT